MEIVKIKLMALKILKWVDNLGRVGLGCYELTVNSSMTDFQLTTPVAFLIFNRPDTTARVFEAIRQAKPPKLLVVADGPRPDRPDDIEKCKAARAIIEGVDWDCEVLKNYSEVNLGVDERVPSGLNWVFNVVDKAIIFEDDCHLILLFFHFAKNC